MTLPDWILEIEKRYKSYEACGCGDCRRVFDSLKIAFDALEFYASFGANLKSTRYYDSNMGLGQEAREALAKIRGEK